MVTETQRSNGASPPPSPTAAPPNAAAGGSQETSGKLYRYAHAGNVQLLESILAELTPDQKLDLLNTKDPGSGELPFHAAAKSGRQEALRLLLPINRDATTRTGMSALHIAARYGHVQAVQWLLSDGRDPAKHEPGANCNIADGEENTPLHHAVMLRRKEVAVALVGAGACISKLNRARLTHISYCRDSETFDEMVEAFLARVDQRHALLTEPCCEGIAVRDAQQKSILQLAAIFSKSATLIAGLVQEYGSLQEQESAEFLQSAAEVGNIHVLEALHLYLGQHVTHMLAAHGHDVAVHALLSNQRPFLDELLDMASSSGVSISITLQSLIDGIPPETKKLLTNEKDGQYAVDEFPMYVLLYAGKFQAFHFLLDCGAQQFNLTVNQWDDKHFRTSLHWAALHQRVDIVETLLKGSGREEEQGNDARTSQLHVSAQRWLRRQPSPTIQDADGKTALQIAFEKRNQDVLEVMRGKASFQQYEEGLYKVRDVYVQCLQAILVGAALIAGVSFAGWLQLPSTEFDHLSMKIFWASNVFAFYTALATICINIAVLIPTPRMYIGTIVKQVRAAVVLDAGVFAVSLTSIGAAFGAAAFAAMIPSPSDGKAPPDPYSLLTLASGSLGSFFFATTMILFLRQFYVFFPTSLLIDMILRSFLYCCIPLPLGSQSRELYPQADMRRLRREALMLPAAANRGTAAS